MERQVKSWLAAEPRVGQCTWLLQFAFANIIQVLIICHGKYSSSPMIWGMSPIYVRLFIWTLNNSNKITEKTNNGRELHFWLNVLTLFIFVMMLWLSVIVQIWYGCVCSKKSCKNIALQIRNNITQRIYHNITKQFILFLTSINHRIHTTSMYI